MRVLEREVERLKEGKPDVVADRVASLSLRVAELKKEITEDMEALRGELGAQRKILIGFFASFAVAAAVLVIGYLLSGGSTP